MVPARRRGERGAVTVFVAVTLSVLLLVAAFAVDLGMQRVARADAQSLADVVALDLARELNQGRSVASLTVGNYDQALANASRDRNLDVLGTSQGHTPTLDVSWGEMNDGTFVPYDETVDAAKQPTAVQVIAHTETGFAFMASHTGKAQRRAVASADKGACFRIGSFVARVQSGQSTLLNPLLNQMLGSNLNLDLISYQGIAAANVSLLDLVETGDLGVGTVSELLGAEAVSVADLVDASIEVLSSPAHGASAATITALQAIHAALEISDLKVDIADLVAASPSDPAALASRINVLDLITGSLLVANGTNAIALPALDVSAGGITATSTLHVIEGPRKRCSDEGDFAETSQIKLTTKITSNALTLPVSLAGLASVVAEVDPIDLTLEVMLAHADATLRSIDGCDTGAAQSAAFQVNTAAVAVPTVSGNIHASLTANLVTGSGSTLLDNLLDGLGGLLSPLASVLTIGATQLVNASLTVDLTAAVQMAGAVGVTASTKTVTVPASFWADAANPKAYTVPGTVIPSISAFSLQPTTVTIGGSLTTKKVLLGVLGFPILGSATVGLISSVGAAATGQLSTALTDATKSLLNALTAGLQATVIKQVSELLGLNIGGADLWVDHEPRCGAPRLVQ
ncbi:hypothetical protein FHP29_08870 [Nocardioides albidus]|uniref:Putative Flp pilus-assembly TadG-like N-terminal domain-containing protein n=1 Tax=Nocardioides albidus TaxID=1517589 RepID=A0A5C4VYU0_9ACTN|nr:pilus assembly protein TadG-related protein [Nocardioides albidus]TNM41117.1 hypothetical protein FHP29_08870 [Nocardioides albidus]